MSWSLIGKSGAETEWRPALPIVWTYPKTSGEKGYTAAGLLLGGVVSPGLQLANIYPPHFVAQVGFFSVVYCQELNSKIKKSMLFFNGLLSLIR